MAGKQYLDCGRQVVQLSELQQWEQIDCTVSKFVRRSREVVKFKFWRVILLHPPKRLCFQNLFVCLFVCLLAEYTKTTRPIFAKLGEKVAREPRKNPLDFGCSTDHVTLHCGYG